MDGTFLLGVGCQKGGTSWVYEYLESHPAADLGPKKWQRAGVPDIPVIYIRAVAVREDMQGKGLGTALVVDAMRRCFHASNLLSETCHATFDVRIVRNRRAVRRSIVDSRKALVVSSTSPGP